MRKENPCVSEWFQFNFLPCRFQLQQSTERLVLIRWQNSCRRLCLILSWVFFFKDNPLARHAGRGALMCIAYSGAKAADVHGRQRSPGRWKSFWHWSPKNLLPGSAETEEWPLWLAESELFALADDESRGTPFWTQRGMFPLLSPARTPRPVPCLPWHEKDEDFKQCR